MKFNVIDNFKKILIAITSLLLVGVIVLCIFGLNLGTELNGYTEINVNIGCYNIVEEDDVKKYTKDIVSIIEDNDARVIQTNIADSNFDSVLVVTVRNKYQQRDKNQDFAKELQTKIEQHYDDELLVVSNRVVSGIMTNVSGVKLASMLLVTLIVVMIYLIFRIKLLNTVCTLIASISSFLIFFDLVILTRVQVNTSIFALISLTVLLSLILSSFKFAEMKKSTDKTLSKNEIGTIKLNSPTNIMFAIIILGMIGLIIFGSIIVKNFAIGVILSLISVWIADNIICLPICYFLNNYTVEKVKPVEVVSEYNENNELEQESNEENQETEESDNIEENND